MDAAGQSPQMEEEAARFLQAQRRLVDLQAKHFDEDQRLAMGAAQRRRFADDLRNVLQLFEVAVALVASVAVAATIWDAAHDHGLVVEGFSMPPDLAQQGLTGQVVAQQVLDQLADLQAQTVSMRPASSYQNDWGRHQPLFRRGTAGP